MRVRLLYACALVCGVFAFMFATVALVSPRPASQAAAAAPLATTTLAATPTTPTKSPRETYAVEKVVDGDTVDIRMGTTTVRLRLVGMDTPEIADPRKPVQCFGPEASAEGHKLLEHQRVSLEYDEVSGKIDKYGRTLAYVFVNGVFYNELMIRQGFAHEYDYQNQKYKYRARFRAAEIRAKEEQLGFWSPSTCDGNTTKPAGAK